MKKVGLFLAAAVMIAITACDKDDEKTYIYEDGTYRAEEADFSHNYKAFLVVNIENDEFVSVDFDYVNPDGGLKSETTAETYPMTPHPSVWLPEYEAMVMDLEITAADVEVDGVSGATGAWESLNVLLDTVLEAAKTGNHETVVLPAE